MHGLSLENSGFHTPVLTHVMVDMYGIDFDILNDPDRIADVLREAARVADLQPLSEPTVYRYPGQGLTGFLPIRESHVSVHTYPEYGYASADVVSCAVAERARRAGDHMVEELCAERVEMELVHRGFLSGEAAGTRAPAPRAGAGPGQ